MTEVSRDVNANTRWNATLASPAALAGAVLGAWWASVEPEEEEFLDSIVRFRDLPADTLALPSHGKPFTGVHRRIEQLQEHHRDRLAALRTRSEGR